MNNWWKGALLGAGALGLSALTGGVAAGPLAGLLGGAGEGAAAAGTGAAALGEGAAAGAGMGGASAAGMMGAAAPELSGALAGTDLAYGATAATPGATAFVTPPVTGGLMGGTSAANMMASAMAPQAAAGSLVGTDAAYGGAQALANAPSVAPSALQQAGEYARMGGKAASAYGTVQQGMGAGQQPMQAPAPRPIFQGPAPQIAPQGLMGNPQQNQFAQMLLAQRQRGMLG